VQRHRIARVPGGEQHAHRQAREGVERPAEHGAEIREAGRRRAGAVEPGRNRREDTGGRRGPAAGACGQAYDPVELAQWLVELIPHPLL
jgi:hypothetical protein